MGSQVTRVMGFLPANFQLAKPFHSRLRVSYRTDRQTDRRRPSMLNASPDGDKGTRSSICFMVRNATQKRENHRKSCKKRELCWMRPLRGLSNYASFCSNIYSTLFAVPLNNSHIKKQNKTKQANNTGVSRTRLSDKWLKCLNEARHTTMTAHPSP